MDDYIYCYDKKKKNELVKAGFKLFKKTMITDKPCWLFNFDELLLKEKLNFEFKPCDKLIFYEGGK